jgi:glyoxylase-like metal-dependent hydrolase (beta-lactamase superfamily II)
MTMRQTMVALGAAITVAISGAAQAAPAAKPLFQPWINGTTASEPKMQVQRYDGDTYVIRQSVHTNYEAPFLYLLFGNDRVLLLDSGAGGLEVRPTIDRVIAEWLAEHHRKSIPLVVAHSHSHGDHHQGDSEFEARPDTVVVGLAPTDVATFFHVANWPTEVVKYDLGGRVLDIVPTPGHQFAHIMVFDERTRLLLSGDTLYPGRLYVPANQFGSFRDSIDRVAAFTKDRHVSHILGAHIEMTLTPGKDYAKAAPVHADEHLLELPYSVLTELQAAVDKMGDTAVLDTHPDFIVFPRDPVSPPPPPAAH